MTSVPTRPSPKPRRRRTGAATTGLAVLASAALVASLTGTAQAASTAVPLGTAGDFAVLAGAGITNTGPTTITGDIGTFPTTTVTGDASIVLNGTDHAGDAVTQGAKSDLVTAYDDAAGQGPPTAVAADLAGLSLTAGVYNSASSLGLSGQLTLDAAGDPDAVFVFQAGSTLTTGSGSSVVLLNGAQACNVYWQVGSSATLGTASDFRGTILAMTSITLTTAATVEGRVLARDGQVSLDSNVITRPGCSTPVTPTPTPTPTVTPVPSPVPTPSPSAPSSAPVTSSAGDGSGSDDDGQDGTGATDRPTTYGQVDRVPVGSVDTGDGSAAQEHRSPTQ
ncbi:ice-binding family protein [Modestobacter italicus]|uniref:ice-binding family protein n=1 Tax=Modestobacter italicus (strain DSM 44449 / CECT 9708 / BC 501) TaxID=2732864 RepID=UPI001C93B5BE|nr:ice-binding family protein [Modestobacter italicus]